MTTIEQKKSIINKLIFLGSKLLENIHMMKNEENCDHKFYIFTQIDFSHVSWDSVLNDCVKPNEITIVSNWLDYFLCDEEALYKITIPSLSYKFDISEEKIMKMGVKKWIDHIIPKHKICNIAASKGYLNIFEWSRKKYLCCYYTSYYLAAKNGHFELVKWIGKHHPWKISACEGAAEGGHLNILKWLIDQGFPCGNSLCTYAALGGHVHILEWLWDQGYNFSETTCARAAEGGHFEVIKWLRDKNCPWDDLTCEFAKNCGHLDILKWCIENGCDCDYDTFEEA